MTGHDLRSPHGLDRTFDQGRAVSPDSIVPIASPPILSYMIKAALSRATMRKTYLKIRINGLVRDRRCCAMSNR